MRAGRAIAGLILLALAPSAGAAEKPVAGPAHSYGGAALGCMQGAVPLPLTGDGWQVLTPADNRYWGSPRLVSLIEDHARLLQGYGSLLIGDMSLPRGGRMPTGHASHQTGLDADIEFALADHRLSAAERDKPDYASAVEGGKLVPSRWGAPQEAVLKSFAGDARIERIFVNPVIKRHLCQTVTGDRSWLHVIRPWWGHMAHFHVRIVCAAGDDACQPGPEIADGDGCGAELQWWFDQGAATTPTNPGPHKPFPRYRPDMPLACKAILKGY